TIADMIRILVDRPRLEQDGRPAVIAAERYVVGVASVQQLVKRRPLHFELATFFEPLSAGRQPKTHLLSATRGDPGGEPQALSAIGNGVDDAPESSETAGAATPANAHRLTA